MENHITIHLFGIPYTFKADIDTDKADKITSVLLNHVEEIQTRQSNSLSEMTKLTVTILAALNIANENYELEKSHSNLIENIFKRSADLINRIDARLQNSNGCHSNG